MSQIMKTFTGLFMVLLMGVTASGILGMLLAVIGAQNLENSIRSRIAASCYAPSVMAECFAAAQDQGDELEVILYTEDGQAKILRQTGDIPADCGNVKNARVRLFFTVETRIPPMRSAYTFTAYIP